LLQRLQCATQTLLLLRVDHPRDCTLHPAHQDEVGDAEDEQVEDGPHERRGDVKVGVLRLCALLLVRATLCCGKTDAVLTHLSHHLRLHVVVAPPILTLAELHHLHLAVARAGHCA